MILGLGSIVLSRHAALCCAAKPRDASMWRGDRVMRWIVNLSSKVSCNNKVAPSTLYPPLVHHFCLQENEEEEEEEEEEREDKEEEPMVDLPQVVPFSSADEESITGRVAPAATVDDTTPTKVNIIIRVLV